MKAPTKEDLDKILKENSTLGKFGFNNGIEDEINFLDFDFSVGYMYHNFIRKNKYSNNSLNSYSIKHIVENCYKDGYIPNGAVIAAGIYLKIPYKKDGYNAIFRLEDPTCQD